ncbi:MAG: T9SS type A sorting domain-containing protein, partial [Ignavibacteria bacterium]
DNLNSGSTFEEIEFKQIKINALLKGLNARDGNANISTNSNPLSFDLLQNYPNPFNPRTIINYELRIRNFVMLKVYDITGREVATLVNDIMPAGKHAVEFNANGLSSGIYFYSLNVDGKQLGVKRMALVK